MRSMTICSSAGELLDIKAVVAATSLSKPTIYRLMQVGRFPKAKPLTPGGRRVAWKRSEVMAWIDDPFGWGDEIAF
jgi:predicted DNA-binding transcriptional regulator AlpA